MFDFIFLLWHKQQQLSMTLTFDIEHPFNGDIFVMSID